MTKISIIVPVYNTEKYLAQCLDSIIKQTLKDIEILCIDDGSKDNSLEILNEYAAKDDRIKIFAQKNSGPGAARNLGIQNATGEYLTFVDSDDWLKENAMECIYNFAKEKNTDMLFFSNINYHDEFYQETVVLNNVIVDKELINFENSYRSCLKLPVVTFGKLYRTKFLKDNNILFPTFSNCGEDFHFAISTFFKNPKIDYIDEPLYFYRIIANNSLTKQGVQSHVNMYKIWDDIYTKLLQINFKNKQEIIKILLKRMALSMLHWYSIAYNASGKWATLYLLERTAKKIEILPKKELKNFLEYRRLKITIKWAKIGIFQKFFSQIFEIEDRGVRIAVYLFGKQILNFSGKRINDVRNKFTYFLRLLKLRFAKNYRKIRIGFILSETSKWNCQDLYNKLLESKYFEPIILLKKDDYTGGFSSNKEKMELNREFCRKNFKTFYEIYNDNTNEYIQLDEFNIDILFYQSPWEIKDEHSVGRTSKFALLCYVPYCFYSIHCWLNYMPNFHAKIWKYFIETEFHKKNYKQFYKANNTVVVGSAKFDAFRNVEIKKDKDKKTIIYAPHHAFENGIHKTATFMQNGNFILELAKKHPEINWVFRPHPSFINAILNSDLMKKEEIEQYYKEWRKIGRISSEADYHELLMNSDALITDCISFLSEYLLVQKPVFHLRSEKQQDDFLDIVKEISKTYYQIHNTNELQAMFNKVIIEGDDYLANERKAALRLLNIDKNKSSGEKVYDYLVKALKIKE